MSLSSEEEVPEGEDDEEEEIDSLLREAGRISKISSTTTMSSEPDRIGKKLGRFRIVSELGRGGMGIVYEAEDLELGRRVALKVLPSGGAVGMMIADVDRRRRFLREAKAAAAVSHPNLVAVFDVGETDGTVFLAMELVRGPSLRTKMDEAAPKGMDPAKAIAIMIQIARGVGKAHASNIVHRDLKPENVMIDDAADGAAKVVDFGLAKLVAPKDRSDSDGGGGGGAGDMSTQDGKILGTPSYMAPEQAKASRVSPAADVFSLGVVLYEMLTGARPFAGTTLVDVLVSVAHDTPPAPSKRAPSEARISRELDRIVLRCLTKDPASRYATADALADALEAAPIHHERRLTRGGGVIAIIALAASALFVVALVNIWPARSGSSSGPGSSRVSVQAEPTTPALPAFTPESVATPMLTASSEQTDVDKAAPVVAMTAVTASAMTTTLRSPSPSAPRSATPRVVALPASPSTSASASPRPSVDPLARQK